MLPKLEQKKGGQERSVEGASNKPKRGEGEGAAKPKPRKILNILGAALKEDIKGIGKVPAAGQGNGDAKASTNTSTLNPDAEAKMAVQKENYRKMAILIRKAQGTGNWDFLSRRIGLVYKSMPTPITKLEKLQQDLNYKKIQTVKNLVWDKMAAELLNKDDLMNFYGLLEKWSNRKPYKMSNRMWEEIQRRMFEEGVWCSDKYITIRDYLNAVKESDIRFKKMLTAGLWLDLFSSSDDQGFQRVPIISIFNYVMKQTWLKETRLSLMNYDDFNTGCLTEDAFESYIKDHLPTLHQLSGLDPGLEPYYLCAVTRKFFFFLDPNHIGRMKIIDALASMLIDEILELREAEVDERNWFSKESVIKLYGHYVSLDRDANGMLSSEEFLEYCYSGSGHSQFRLTPSFVGKLYAEKQTYSDEMDFRAFVDFVLAMENRIESQSIGYFFSILDISKKGYLDASDLHFFYKDIYSALSEYGSEAPKFDDVKDEIFDMVKPSHPLRITKKDLVNCGKGDVVISMLIDAKGFDDYENREFVLHEQAQNFIQTNSEEPPQSPVVELVEDDLEISVIESSMSNLKICEDEEEEAQVVKSRKSISSGAIKTNKFLF